MAHITLKNVIDDGRTLLQNHSQFHHITDIWRKITINNAALNSTTCAVVARPTLLLTKITCRLFSRTCLQIAAAIVSLMPRLPFNMPTVKPREFYLTQWISDANSITGSVNKLIYSLARIPDAIHLVYLFGPLSKYKNQESSMTSNCSCNKTDVESAGCNCKEHC